MLKITLEKNTMKKILFATDFTNSSKNALIVTKMLAFKEDALINLIHVNNFHLYDPSIPTSSIIENYEIIKNNNTKKLNELKNDLIKEGLKVKTTLLDGTLIETIKEYLKEHPHDLLIIGENKKDGFIEKIFGHNSEQLIKHVTIPILTIPENLKTLEFNKLIVCLALEEIDIELLKKVKKINKTFNCKIVLFHAITKWQTNIDNDKKINNHLSKLLKNENYEFVNINAETVTDAIEIYTKTIDNFILITNTYSRNFIEQLIDPSQTIKIIDKFKVPILTFVTKKEDA